MKRNVKRKRGNVYQITVDGKYYYAIDMGVDAVIGVFKKSFQRPIHELKNLDWNMGFMASVEDFPIKHGLWSLVGQMDITEEMSNIPDRFIQDMVDKTKFFIYRKGEMIVATKDECIGLERAAVWSSEQIESRIRDMVMGVENRWVAEMTKID